MAKLGRVSRSADTGKTRKKKPVLITETVS